MPPLKVIKYYLLYIALFISASSCEMLWAAKTPEALTSSMNKGNNSTNIIMTDLVHVTTQS